MQRNKNQAVYKNLPEMWISYNGGDERTVTIKINYWNDRPMEDIYSKFIDNELKRQIRLFGARGGDTDSFHFMADKEAFLISETAGKEGIPDVKGEISPLVFYCSSCHTTKQLYAPSSVNESTWKCKKCNKISMKQLQMIYSCECGYVQPIKIPYIEGVKDYFYDPTESSYKMYYMQGKNKKNAEFNIECPNCHNRLFPDNAESSRNYKPFTLKIINLLDKKSGDFYEKGIDAQKTVIMHWFEKLDDKEYLRILDNIELAFSENSKFDTQKQEAERQAKELISSGFADENKFNEIVRKLLDSKNKTLSIEKYVLACDELFYLIKNKGEDVYKHFINYYSFKLMQYNTIKYAQNTIRLSDSIKKQIELEFIDNADEIYDMNYKLGIKNMQVSCDIEIVNCAYGYTRKVADPNNSLNMKAKLKLSSFAKSKDGTRNLVYGVKLETEGILFEINQRKILEWLFINDIVKIEQLPDLDDESSVKRWFAENIQGELISVFGGLNESESLTKNVFGLLHSICHGFIKTIGEISGLASTSLSEIIIVETASIFIYANTGQGIPLGSLSGMIETNYMQFLEKTFEDNRNCIYDPICIERDNAACAACMQLPEVTCNHFNVELSRNYLYSYKSSNNLMKGFWDM